MKVLITGAGGQLGHELCRAFADHDVVGLAHDALDITVEAAVAAAVDELGPELVVNAAAWMDVDGCEADGARAHAVNALGPWWLARACARSAATLVHVSTDYVFGGALDQDRPREADGTPRGWSEFDPVAPVNVYGRSKAAGETLVRQTLPSHHIVRTSWVHGPHGHNFVRTMLRLGHEGMQLRVVDDQIGSPTATPDLAVAIRELAVSGRFGTWHRTNRGRCSWFDLARATFALADLDVDLAPQPSRALERPAPRPAWSVLDATHATASGLNPLPHWVDGLARVLDELGELRRPDLRVSLADDLDRAQGDASSGRHA
jgi:dTDP-4-dehydrorhamnose reductase